MHDDLVHADAVHKDEVARLNGQLADAQSAASAAQAARGIAEKQLHDLQAAASAERQSLHDQLGQERSANTLHLEETNAKHSQLCLCV